VASLGEDCADLIDAFRDRDPDRIDELLPQVAAAARQAGADEVQDALARLTRLLADVSYGIGGEVVQIAGVLADRAPDPSALLPTLVYRVTEVMEDAAQFAAVWGESLGDPPDPGDRNQILSAFTRLTPVAARSGIGEREARKLVEAWFAGSQWVQTLLYLMQRKDVRVALPSRERLTAASAAVRERIGVAHWLYGLLLVLDDEPLTVLHRPTGRGYRVVVSGIGDNFQLHTLLAARLIGDEARGFLPGERPSAVEIVAATDGPDLTPAGGIRGIFNLVDGFGNWIWNEGRPADIPRLEGERVVVLDPPPYLRSWNAGRVYPLMRPSLEVERVLAAGEAAPWLGLAKPARR
jgi:hypothetical protein